MFLKGDLADDWVSADSDEAFCAARKMPDEGHILACPSSAAAYAFMEKHPAGDACMVGIFAGYGRKFKSVCASQNVMTGGEFDE